MDAHPYSLPPGTLLNKAGYRVDEVLGWGGFGITYAARDLKLDREVAIKEYFPWGALRESLSVVGLGDKGGREWFLREARLLARFRHAGIVPVHGVFEENQTGYMVMERLHGETLAALVERSGPLDEETALDLLDQVARALAVVHEQAVLHRDLKPENLWLTPEGRVVLLDFGSARELVPDKALTAVVSEGYAAPEQYMKEGQLGPQVDVYGLGATLYFLLTGEAPPDVPGRLSGTRLARPKGVSDEAWRVMKRLLSLSPQDRPGNILEWRRVVLTGPPDLAGHRAAVLGLDFSPDGRWLASGSEDKTVKVWDVARGCEAYVLEGHTDWVNSVRFSPCGGLLASGGNDRRICFWDRATGTLKEELPAPDGVLCMDYSFGGSRLAAGLWNGKLLNLRRTDSVVAVLDAHRGGVWSVKFQPCSDGLMATAAAPDHEVLLWKGESVEIRLEGHSSSVRALAATSGLLASGSADCTIRLWSLPDGRPVATLTGHSSSVLALAFTPDGNLISASKNGVVRRWISPNWEPQALWSNPKGGVGAMAVSPTGDLLAVGTRDGKIVLISLD